MKKLMKTFLVGTLVLSMCAGLVGCGSKEAAKPAEPPKPAATSNEAKKTEGGVLRVGMECMYPPFNWTQMDNANGAVKIDGDDGGYANGYDVQMAKKVAEGLGKQLVIVKTSWDGLIPGVNTGILDVIMAGMSPTEDRKASIDFSTNYYKSDLIVVVKKDGPYAKATSLADFKGAKITAQLGTFHASVVEQIDGVKKVTDMEDFGTMRTALTSGVIDGYISERPEGISASNALDTLTYIEFEQGKGFKFKPDDAALAAGIKKGNTALTTAINEILKGVSEEDRQKMMNEAIANQPVLK